MSTKGENNSFSIGYPFSLDVKGGENIGVWRMLGDLGEKLGISTYVFTSIYRCGDQTPKWLP